jgi:hypothetical protein
MKLAMALIILGIMFSSAAVSIGLFLFQTGVIG